jgi:hypothetical protein
MHFSKELRIFKNKRYLNVLGRDSMARLLSIALLLNFIVVTSSSALAKEPLRLAPSSKWHVDYGPDYCRLARQFGEGNGDGVRVFR